MRETPVVAQLDQELEFGVGLEIAQNTLELGLGLGLGLGLALQD